VNEDDDKLKTFTIREEYQMSLLMIGGIQIFLPHSLVEAEISIANVEATTTEARQPAVTVGKEGLEHIFEATQEEKKKEHPKEWLNSFIQEAKKKEVVALKTTTQGA
jgi:hypothetical protein